MQRGKQKVAVSESNSEDDGCVCLRNPLLALFFFLTGYIGMVTVAILLSANNVHNKRSGTSGRTMSATIPPEFYRRQALQAKLAGQAVAEIPIGSQQYAYPMLVDMLDLVERVKRKKAVPLARLHEPVSWLNASNNACDSRNTSNSLELLILVRTEPEHNASREAIRQSWARQNCYFGTDDKTRVLFIMERPRNLSKPIEIIKPVKKKRAAVNSRRVIRPKKPQTQPTTPLAYPEPTKSINQQLNELSIENQLHNDLLVTQSLGAENMRRTGLLVAALDWTKEFCSHARHVLIIDDDYFVQPGLLTQLISGLSESSRERLVAGYVVSNECPARNPQNSNYVPRYSYPSEVYPPYLANAAVLLSVEMAIDIAIASHYVKLFHFDEIFLALILDKLLLHPQHLWNFVSKPQRMSLDPVLVNNAKFSQTFVSHGYQNPNLVRSTWSHTRAKRGYC